MITKLLSVLVLALLLSGCGEKPAPEIIADPPPPVAQPLTYEWSNQPSPVVLKLPAGNLSLRPWTSCWSGPTNSAGTASSMCSDGMPGPLAKLPVVKESRVPFWFGRPGWQFTAAVFHDGKPCGKERAAVTRTGGQEFRLVLAGAAPGTYRVDLFGQGEEGDVATSFAWKVPGTIPVNVGVVHC